MTCSPGVCSNNLHVYPTIYAGDPEYAEDYFSRCLCGKKRKVTTVEEVDNPTINKNSKLIDGGE